MVVVYILLINYQNIEMAVTSRPRKELLLFYPTTKGHFLTHIHNHIHAVNLSTLHNILTEVTSPHHP